MKIDEVRRGASAIDIREMGALIAERRRRLEDGDS